jgi:hypothetical protein
MTEGELLTGGTSAAFFAHLLSMARDRGWIQTIAQHRAVAGILAMLTSLGMQFKFDAADGSWMLSGTLMGLAMGLYHATVQYGAMDLLYKQWARIKLVSLGFEKE